MEIVGESQVCPAQFPEKEKGSSLLLALYILHF